MNCLGTHARRCMAQIGQDGYDIGHKILALVGEKEVYTYIDALFYTMRWHIEVGKFVRTCSHKPECFSSLL